MPFSIRKGEIKVIIVGQSINLDKPRDSIQPFFLNINHRYSCEDIEQIIRDKPSLAKDDVDNILENHIEYIKFRDTYTLRGLLFPINYGLYCMWIDDDDNPEEQTKSEIHEILHIYYRLSDSISAYQSDIVNYLLKKETDKIFDERLGLARHIYISCLMRAVE